MNFNEVKEIILNLGSLTYLKKINSIRGYEMEVTNIYISKKNTLRMDMYFPLDYPKDIDKINLMFKTVAPDYTFRELMEYDKSYDEEDMYEDNSFDITVNILSNFDLNVLSKSTSSEIGRTIIEFNDSYLDELLFKSYF